MENGMIKPGYSKKLNVMKTESRRKYCNVWKQESHWSEVKGNWQGLKLRSNGLSSQEFRPRFTLFPVIGTGRIDVARGFVSAYVVSCVVTARASKDQTAPLHPFTRALPRYLPFEQSRRSYGATVRIPPTTVHKYESRATRGLSKPHAVGSRLKRGHPFGCCDFSSTSCPRHCLNNLKVMVAGAWSSVMSCTFHLVIKSFSFT
ncbi:hypothetical protein AVEN_56825-1 [Araneus ventricosus]|uniref:Uncharacterized protein n=1 Tax=Araneus ventricosus TaxID=182803 RepID=A0A4Y2NFT6_ARAVE|nr:hypothetical protein AVEN_56825-1 [Araneus ventricosus]